MKKIFVVFTLIFSVATLTAQNIIGKVGDAKTAEPLPFANVFLNNTTTGAVSNSNGEFVLKDIPIGTYELVVSFVGYESRKVKIKIRDADLVLSPIWMLPSKTELNNVEIRSTKDKAWEKQLKSFEKVFLGDDKFAAYCHIANPWVIDFPEEKNRFRAAANAPIEILNDALGYKVTYYLSDFWFQGKVFFIDGNVSFTELEATSDAQAETWAKNREEAYHKSYHYFFKSLLSDDVNNFGFDVSTTNKSEGSKSLGFGDWVPFVPTGRVSKDEPSGEFKINMKGEFAVFHQKTGTGGLDIKEEVRVNKAGFVLNPLALRVSGTYGENRVSSLLPISYKENTSVAIKDLQKPMVAGLYERLYVFTDKPYYYPGEAVWFKGYVNYATPEWRDSLSRTLYTELISPEKQIIQSKIVEIDSGFFNNDFVLPNALKAGNYYLRAYTNLNRNYGDSTLYVKSIPILNLTDKVQTDQGQDLIPADTLFTISSDRSTYRSREKITLTIKLQNKTAQPVAANMSISVTDEMLVVVNEKTPTILVAYEKGARHEEDNPKISYPIEYGITFRGTYLNENDKPEKSQLHILQLTPPNFTIAQSDDNGVFSASDFVFYDSSSFSIQAKKNGVKSGKIQLLQREIPPMAFKTDTSRFDIVKTESVQRITSGYEIPTDVRMLNEVIVKGRKIEQVTPYSQDAWSGRIIKGSDLNQTNLLYSLRNTPGVKVDMISGIVRSTRGMMRLGSQQAAGQGPDGGPTYSLSIDGLQIQGPDPGYIGQRLGALDPANIEMMYVGRTHIAVFMKHPEDTKITPNFQMVKVQGYSSARIFNHPDYSNPKTDTTRADYRSTIYWNPNVVTNSKTGTATVSFFAADLPSKYRIVAEGVTKNGEAVRCVYFIEVDG